MHRHANIRHVCETYGQQVLGIRPDDVTFSVAKLFFAYGIGNSLFFPFSVGATTVLERRRPTPDDRRRNACGTERPTLFFAVPTFYAALLSGDLPDDTFASVRLAASAGEALPGPLLTRFSTASASTSSTASARPRRCTSSCPTARATIRPGTTGRPVPGYDVVVVGDARRCPRRRAARRAARAR